MSTANFCNRNADFIYACEFADEFAYDDLLADLRQALRSAAADPKVKAIADYRTGHDTSEPDYNRNYPGRIIAVVWSETKRYRGFAVYLSAKIIVRSGYYEGANLDYAIGCHVRGREYLKDDLDEVCLHSELPGSRRAYQLALAKRWFDRHYAPFTAAIETVFRRHSTPLRLVARASNGEAFYERA
jgi:hypothetical protein